MDLSYAQNLEDYYLSQAFSGQDRGFYIDIGAGHPVCDNVSCWFYLQGWQGIVVEPQPSLIERYAHIRPRDIAIAKAVGRQVGQASFHEVDRLHGFSTIVERYAVQAGEFGAGYRTRTLPMTTLRALCEEHVRGPIDFLKIDVEGAEGEVLAGGDFTRFRPRVILLEALAPGMKDEAWRSFEPPLLAQGYAFVLFDDLNRYYVAKEEAALLARFPKEKADWMVVPHLGHTNRAPFRADHPDHAFAKALVAGFLANLPALDQELVLTMVTHGLGPEALDREPSAADRMAAIARLFPLAKHADGARGLERLTAPSLRELYRRLIDTDQFRIMAGRLAMSYDGGQILDD